MHDDEEELWKKADEMIREHGSDAAARAAARATELAGTGDKQGAAVWFLILHRIGQLKSPPPDATD